MLKSGWTLRQLIDAGVVREPAAGELLPFVCAGVTIAYIAQFPDTDKFGQSFGFVTTRRRKRAALSESASDYGLPGTQYLRAW